MASSFSSLLSSKNKKLYDNSLYPASFANYPRIVDRGNYPIRFAIKDGIDIRSLFIPTARIISCLRGKSDDVAIVKYRDDAFAAEQHFPDGSVAIATGDANGKITACKIEPSGRYTSFPAFPNDEDAVVVFAVYFMLIMHTDIIYRHSASFLNVDFTIRNFTVEGMLDEVIKASDKDFDSADIMDKTFWLDDLFVKSFENDWIPCNLTGNSFSMTSKTNIVKQAYSGDTICGKASVLNGTDAEAGKKTVLTAKAAKKMFDSYSAKTSWTESEEALIPRFDDDYPVLPETVTIAKRFVESSMARRPMRNCMWRGITSYGKSTGVEMLAYLLHKPLLRFTCSSTVEAMDFLSSYVPDNDSNRSCTAEIPSFEDIEMDPAYAWKMLTGESREDVNCDEVFKECIRRTGSGKESTARYKLVESTYVRALAKGYICEIQEISRIKDAGVLVTLNEYDRAGARIPLADGGFVTRHPDAMCVYTDNVGYASCRKIDPSVLRRMDFILDSFELSDAQVLARVKYNTGYSNDKRLRHMLEVWHSVIDFCHENEITDGEISVTELERWANVLIIEGNDSYEEACIECLVSKASPDPDIQKEIKEKVLAVLMPKAELIE